MSPNAQPRPPLYKGYAFDLDGTLYLGEDLIPGAAAAVCALRDAGSAIVFVTNKPLDTNANYAAKLTRLGIPVEPNEVISPIDALVTYLSDNASEAVILPIAEHVLIDSMHDAGFATTDDPDLAEIVVVSFDRTFDYQKLTRAYRAVRRGARIIATNPDPYCPTPEGGIPDCAAMLAAIEACTGAKALAVVGKPSAHMGRALLERLGVDAHDAIMVGDRLLTDVAMGFQSGMSSALVLSGATSAEMLAESIISPTHVLRDVSDLVPTR